MIELPAYLRTTLIRQRWLAAAERFELALADREPDYPGEKKRALQSRLVRREAVLAHAYGELAKLNVRFDPNQPRIPAGQPGAGQWTSGGGGGVAADAGDPLFDVSNTVGSIPGPTDDSSGTVIGFAPNGTPIVAAGQEPIISPLRANYHEYTAGPNMVCSAEERCSREQMADYLSRFAVPGQDPARPVRDKDVSTVHDPYLGTNVGTVTTEVSGDGLSVTNRTKKGHIFYYGQVVRSVIENADGSMPVITRGTGNNINLGLSIINENSGPGIFNRLDAQMRDYIRASRNAKNSLDYSYFLPGADLNQRCLGLRRTQASHAS